MRPTAQDELATDSEGPYPSRARVVNSALRVEGGHSYRGRSAVRPEIRTEGEAIHSDRAAEVSSGHSSRASGEAQTEGKGSRRRDSMSGKRPEQPASAGLWRGGASELQWLLAKGPNARGEVRERKPANHEQLMEEVCERENCLQAFKRVKSTRAVGHRRHDGPVSYRATC